MGGEIFRQTSGFKIVQMWVNYKEVLLKSGKAVDDNFRTLHSVSDVGSIENFATTSVQYYVKAL